MGPNLKVVFRAIHLICANRWKRLWYPWNW